MCYHHFITTSFDISCLIRDSLLFISSSKNLDWSRSWYFSLDVSYTLTSRMCSCDRTPISFLAILSLSLYVSKFIILILSCHSLSSFWLWNNSYSIFSASFCKVLSLSFLSVSFKSFNRLSISFSILCIFALSSSYSFWCNAILSVLALNWFSSSSSLTSGLDILGATSSADL